MTRSKQFIDNFWESDIMSSNGFDIVCRRMKDGRKMYKDLEDYLNQRGKIENNYAKELQKLVKNMEIREDCGELEKSWNQMRQQVEGVAHVHEKAHAQFRGLADDINRSYEALKLQLKQHEDRVTRSHNTVKSCMNKCTSQHKTYDQKCGDWYTANHEMISLEKLTPDSKNFTKVKHRESKTKEEMEKSDGLYQNAVEAVNKAQATWESDIKEAFETFQRLDEERIDTIRDVIWKETNVDSFVCVDKDDCCERIRQSLERVDIDKEVTDFITKRSTGNSRPEYVEYKKNYFSESTNTQRKNGNRPPARPVPSVHSQPGIYQDINL